MVTSSKCTGRIVILDDEPPYYCNHRVCHLGHLKWVEWFVRGTLQLHVDIEHSLAGVLKSCSFALDSGINPIVLVDGTYGGSNRGALEVIDQLRQSLHPRAVVPTIVISWSTIAHVAWWRDESMLRGITALVQKCEKRSAQGLVYALANALETVGLFKPWMTSCQFNWGSNIRVAGHDVSLMHIDDDGDLGALLMRHRRPPAGATLLS